MSSYWCPATTAAYGQAADHQSTIPGGTGADT